MLDDDDDNDDDDDARQAAATTLDDKKMGLFRAPEDKSNGDIWRYLDVGKWREEMMWTTSKKILLLGR